MTGKKLLSLVEKQHELRKSVISPLCAIHAHAINTDSPPMAVMPHLFIRSAISCGKIIEKVSESIVENGLVELRGRYDLIRFELRYCNPDCRFTELRRLIAESTSAAGHRCSFKGIVAVDISKWRGHFHEDFFNMALAFLHDCSDDWYIIFSLEKGTDTDYREAQKVISGYFRTICLDVPVLSKEDAAECFGACFADLGFSSGTAVNEYIMDTVAEHGKTIRRLDYELIEMISSDLVCYSIMNGNGNKITIKAVRDYFADETAFVYRHIQEEKMAVGFLGGKINDQRV